MNWIEIKAKVSTVAVEAVSEIYYEFGAQGVAIEEPISSKNLGPDNLYWDYFDETENSEVESTVIAYFSTLEEELNEKIQKIKGRILNLKEYGIDIGSGEIQTQEVKQEDWETSWKQYFKPIKITEKVVIKPQWEEYTKESDEIVIQIDPGMAFGTGSHETTSMCIQGIEQNIQKGDTVLDVGTGSGVLSIAAVLLGAKSANGIDLDPVAVAVAKENVGLNGLSSQIEIEEGDLVSTVSGEYNIVVSNIIAEAILILLDNDIKRFIKENGLFICSGIILEKEGKIIEKLVDKGFNILHLERKGEWVSIVSRA